MTPKPDPMKNEAVRTFKPPSKKELPKNPTKNPTKIKPNPKRLYLKVEIKR